VTTGKTDRVGPILLSGGNPQIPKGYGDALIRAYIDAQSGWKREAWRRLDGLIEQGPGVRRAVKWNAPLYDVDDRNWFLSVHAFADYLKVAFFTGGVFGAHAACRVQTGQCALLAYPRERADRRGVVSGLGKADPSSAAREDVGGIDMPDLTPSQRMDALLVGLNDWRG